MSVPVFECIYVEIPRDVFTFGPLMYYDIL